MMIPCIFVSQSIILALGYSFAFTVCFILYFRFTTMARTRELLRDGKYTECLALVRAARCVHLSVCT